MNKRTILIIAALALPVILLALVIHSSSNTPPAKPPAIAGKLPGATGNATNFPPHATLQQARDSIQRRLTELEKMTPDQWTQEKQKHPWAAASLQDALNWNKNQLAKLNAMTQEQWEAQWEAKYKAKVATKSAAVPTR